MRNKLAIYKILQQIADKIIITIDIYIIYKSYN